MQTGRFDRRLAALVPTGRIVLFAFPGVGNMIERNYVAASQPVVDAGGNYQLTYMSGLRTKLATDVSVAVGSGLLLAVPMALWGPGLEGAAAAGAILALIALGVRLTGLIKASQLAALIVWQQVRIAQVVDHNKQLAGMLNHAEARAAALQRELAMKSGEADALRSQSQKGWRSADMLESKARIDALHLLKLTDEAGGWVARDAALLRLSWERERWEAAYEVLQRAGVVRKNHRTTVILLQGADALRALEVSDE